MSDIISQALTTPVQIVLAIVCIVVIFLWLVSILWVNRDARTRSTSAVLWTIVAVIPVAGLIAYCLLRPPNTTADEDEQGMELDLIARQLDAFGTCPQCGTPTREDYLVCPNCNTRLRRRCTHCSRPLKLEWKVCPWCAKTVSAAFPDDADDSASAVPGIPSIIDGDTDPFAPVD